MTGVLIIPIPQINVPVTQRPSSAARTAVAFLNFGCATLTTTAVMTRMSQRTCAGRGTAPRDGRGVRASPTTDAFPSGCSAMVKMTAGMAAMSSPRTVPRVNRRRTLSARITGAFQSELLGKGSSQVDLVINECYSFP